MSQRTQEAVAIAQSEETRKRFTAGLNWLLGTIDMQVLSGERRLVYEKLQEAKWWWDSYCRSHPPYQPLAGAAGSGQTSQPQPSDGSVANPAAT